MPIQKLSPLLINQIAAGEVIERPASVVKELVENGIDAGATQISVVVEDGGRSLIRVSDNGSGISEHELPLAVAPHATSKLTTAEQLHAVGTMGFRGEALASIASVSRLRISSRATIAGVAAESGAMIEAEGDRVSAPIPAGVAPGTVVEVRDLFFNTPVRRKFTRAASTEFGHISEIVTRLAMSQPCVAFRLTHGARTAIDLPAGQSRRARCVALLGQDLDEVLLEFESEEKIKPGDMLATTGDPGWPEANDGPAASRHTGIRTWGLAGTPTIARATNRHQYLCVNGRPIQDRSLSHAVKEAYRGLIPPDKYPTAVVFIEVPGHVVDVNVHPTKAQVRFSETNRMHGQVLTAIRQRLLGTDLTPTASMTTSLSKKMQPSEASSLSPTISTDAFVGYFKQMDPYQKGFVFEQVKEVMGPDATGEPLFEGHDHQASRDVAGVGDASPGTSMHDLTASSKVLQVHDSYLVTQDELGLLIVDQHALHERVMFEQLVQRVTAKDLESQRLLTPAVMKSSASRCAMLEPLRPLLKRIGIEAEPIGPDAVAVHAFASFLFDRRVDPVEFMEDLLDRVEAQEIILPESAAEPTYSSVQLHSAREAVLHKVLDMMACKAAVKAGDHLTPQELEDLLGQRERVERSSNCPHGRPTSHRITLKDLAKQFQRT